MTKNSKSRYKQTDSNDSRLATDIFLTISILLAIFTFLSLISHSYNDPSFSNIIFSTYEDKLGNYFGKIGAYVSDLLGTLFGSAALIIPFLLLYLSFLLYSLRLNRVTILSPILVFVYSLLLILVSSSFLGLVTDMDIYFSAQKSGGLFGVIASEFIVSTIGKVGGVITFLLLVIISIMLLFSLSFADMSKSFIITYNFLKPKIERLIALIKSKTILIINKIKDMNNSRRDDSTDLDDNDNLDDQTNQTNQTNQPNENIPIVYDKNSPITTDENTAIVTATETYHGYPLISEGNITTDELEDLTIKACAIDQKDCPVEPDNEVLFIDEMADNSDDKKPTVDAIKPVSVSKHSLYSKYSIPVDILDKHDNLVKGDSKEELDANGNLLLEKLSDFGVQGKVRAIYPGPVVTMYEFEPAPGTRISKIATLENDLALNMSALSIRIIAPIPGKNAVGIEVPNKNRASVFIRELLQSVEFANETSPLTVALGKSAGGKPFFSDIAKMPHLLVAGTTGSGKSVGLNTIIVSILYKSSPDHVKFIMIDPKMVELSIYNDIPHLWAPVVTDPKLASSVLKNVATEMDFRYEILAEKKVRNIEGYNQMIANDPELKKMHYLVVVVDEFADLMMIAGKDVEFSITRIAQKARAVGIHLIIATQRPTANVITGLIKSNMPARIAFKVSQKNDSRVILDQNGADMLLGRGDSLFMPPGTSDLIRIHGAFVSDEEVRNIVEHLARFGKPEYNMDMVKEVKDPADERKSRHDQDDYDDKYQEALDVIYEKGHASISLIQRHLKIGYNRAARIVEMMEKEGVIAPSDGTAKPREVIRR